jgi:hypothetical protein
MDATLAIASYLLASRPILFLLYNYGMIISIQIESN